MGQMQNWGRSKIVAGVQLDSRLAGSPLPIFTNGVEYQWESNSLNRYMFHLAATIILLSYSPDARASPRHLGDHGVRCVRCPSALMCAGRDPTSTVIAG
jgi:hypothetical protein